MELKFKLGDNVIFLGCIKAKIVAINDNDDVILYLIYSKQLNHQYHVDGYWWTSERKLTLDKNNKSFYTDKATIYYDENGNKYVSKCHDEEFDLEKGVAMCLLKSKGINYEQFQEIVKTFENKSTQKEEEDFEDFKVGDRVQFKTWEEMEKQYGHSRDGDIATSPCFRKYMKHLCGTYATIGSIYDNGIWLSNFTAKGDTDWFYCKEMVKKVK